jgi:two-component system chemotaxis response regulator CheB
MSPPIRVMIVDDSALVRAALGEVLRRWDDIEVIATARDAFQAADKLREAVPDVILLDIEMPRLDGLAFLRQLMKQHPIPTIICSAVAHEGSANAIAALEAGALEIIHKPNLATRAFFEASSEHLHESICAAASARVFAARGLQSQQPARTGRHRHSRSLQPGNAGRSQQPARRTELPAARSLKPGPRRYQPQTPAERVLVIGASTGGTEAIRVYLEHCNENTPGIVIVQHMPAGFTASLARRLDQICGIRVKEAEHNEPVLVGQALIAPGDRHVVLRCAGKRHYVELLDTAHINRHRPSVDVLFNSAADRCGKHTVGVIMTGMGDDGARGLKALRDAGAETFAQDEATCVVYGMPREAVRLGGVRHSLPLQGLSAATIAALNAGVSRSST